MLLYINTSEFDHIKLALIKNQKIFTLEKSLAYNENHKSLAVIEQFLKTNKVKLHNLTKIIVNNGPGSFTGIRVGVALSQALGLSLNIPVITLPTNKLPDNLLMLQKLKTTNISTLNYGREPNITKPKN